ncbi:MAG: LL-diaminopimelate aminotransferase [Proteobacteria bacterium]|nr:LL-diaminopimelate aminotransferase [Desulfobacterales bacterium]MBL7102315.1 LL-diaminopimelate aminotransferase [Desulfobacteraceae bacterium]MBL7173462.1 LL-diaminopimelate aminotransferase [Desulfobacteraceae bacterium]MBU0990338.1 LL-diaminopimelate aminotransferase [Pseudomonadota bacterium]MBU1903126.1 LL-diaminopimelate aminotransferase [Pseudomonadota bacterium]
MKLFEYAERLRQLPPYLFKEIDRKKAEVMARGVDIIDLGVGDPDLSTPEHIIGEMKRAVEAPANHRYPSYSGMNDFKEAVAGWYQERFGVDLDPDREVVSLIGSKEGLAHLPLAFINPGDVALVPTPAYPVYNIATLFAGGESFFMPLLSENNYLPDLKTIPEQIAERAKIMFINYPNNPTAAVADLDFFARVVEFAAKHRIVVCHDAAYTEMAFDGYRPCSFLEAEGAREVGMEFHSLSKTYNMTGWRIGFAVGNEKGIEGLGAIKSNIDSGVFQAVQKAGIAAIRGDQSCVRDMVQVYAARRDIMVRGLRVAGFEVESPRATFYMWVKVPEGYTSTRLATRLLEDAGVVVTPGNGFGEPGEGYFRIALTQNRKRLSEALERIKEIKF